MFVLLYGLTIAIATPVEFAVIALALPLIWLSVTDFFFKIIPDSASMMVAVWGIAPHSQQSGRDHAIDLVVAIVLLVALWLASEVYWRLRGNDALGLGDVKLLAAGVLCVGAAEIWLAVLIATLGGIVSVLLSRFRATGPESGVPFGPFIAYGLFLTVMISGAV